MISKRSLACGLSLAVLATAIGGGAAYAQDAGNQQSAGATMSSAEMQERIEQLESQLTLLQQAQAEQSAAAVSAIKEVRHPDKAYYKGVSITLGGFLAAESVYRDHNLGSDVATGFQNIPFNGPTGAGNPSSAAAAGHADELRASARQSRLSMLVQGDVNPDTHLAMYGEFDFLGAARTANNNESNSFNLRIRHLYGTVDWDQYHLHLLAGQNWSLATMNTKGITPRNELTPPQIDAQYIPGFVWTRQPQVRLTEDLFDKHLWLSISAENPATTFGPTAVAATVRTVFNIAGGSNFDAANNLSLNHAPDIIGKVAYETDLTGKGNGLHLEGFGMYRDFYDRLSTDNGATFHDQDATGYGFGFGAVLNAIPKVLDLQVSALGGQGIGRYGSSQLPDVTFRNDGKIEPISETMWLAGGTWHADTKLDIYGFAGQEQEDKKAYTVGTTAYGLGNTLARVDGCLSEVSTGTCTVNTRSVTQGTAGFWWKFYQGSMGRMQFGAQYSYTERKSFAGSNAAGGLLGAAKGDENIIFTSLRYYPF